VARAVRISRLPGSNELAPEGDEGGELNRPVYRPNTHALTRAGRLFAVYLMALVVILVLFLGVLLDTPTGGSGSGAYLLLAALAAVLAVAGFALTLVRTPRGVETRGDGFVVTEFLGTRRVFPHRGVVDLHVENRHPGGLLSPAPTQVLAVSTPSGPTRRYLVELNLIPGREESGTD
jgi:hypothetical protein